MKWSTERLTQWLASLDPSHAMIEDLLRLAEREGWADKLSHLSLGELSALWEQARATGQAEPERPLPPKAPRRPLPRQKGRPPAEAPAPPTVPPPVPPIIPSLAHRVLDHLLAEPWSSVARLSEALNVSAAELDDVLAKLLATGEVRTIGDGDSPRYGLG